MLNAKNNTNLINIYIALFKEFSISSANILDGPLAISSRVSAFNASKI